MRALSIALNVGIVAVLSLFAPALTRAATLQNPDFETGDFTGWTISSNRLAVDISTNETFNRNCAGRIHGSFASTNWITNSISQTVLSSSGDNLDVLGFAFFKTHQRQSAAGTGYVQAVLSGGFGSTSKVWAATNSWGFFHLTGKLFGAADSGFESGSLDNWNVTCDDLVASVQSVRKDSGVYALYMDGIWSNGWSWNEVNQYIPLQSGDVIECSARIYCEVFQKFGGWAVAGIKLELTNSDFEAVVDACYTSTWETLSVTAVITNTGVYTYRCMVCGDCGVGGVVTSKVFFDEVKIWKQGQASGGDSDATLSFNYIGKSGGSGFTNTVDAYLDSVCLKGSTATLVPATNILTDLRNEAAAVGTNPAVTVPPVIYPQLFYYGSPNYETNVMNFPSSVQVGFVGWKFKNMSNNIAVWATNTIETYGLGTNGYGFIEIDQYQYAGKYPGKERGEPLEIRTNAPYFTIGQKDGSSAEFGEGPFNGEHTYVVGTSLTNFPRRLSTDGSGGWPRKLNIVFQENFSTNQFTNSLWQKYFVLNGVATNGTASNVKALKIGLYASNAGISNDLACLSQELHLGWAPESQCWGMVDYPNLTYQDHNEVALRAGWLHNVVDYGGWYMAQSPRGSATIEPIDLSYLSSGNWTPKPYEEYLFTWPNAGACVRSLYDDDSVDRIPGPASYHVGFKIGHANGTNEQGDVQYPEVLNIRGCGYFRMTDYDGVMAGSFRPMAADIFGLYQSVEDAPLIPKAYVRVVPRTTPTNLPNSDNSYAEAYISLRSKTNEWQIGTGKVDMHFAPDEVASNGCYFDFEADTWANKAVVVTQHGAVAYFSQVSMHWRGGTNINDGTEGHDIDCVMVKKASGEWVTHEVLNPPTNIYQRTLATFASNDVVYLLQQDRGESSYGFATEAPYRRASAFEISMIDDGGRDLNLDVYENSTVSEIADNVNVTCQLNHDLAEGEHLHYKYRYRTVYAPGVYLIRPNDTAGGENWSNNSYQIEFFATDGHDKPLQADLYYGNGRDNDWRLINTNETILVNTNTHKVVYNWNVNAVTPGSYYVKATARRIAGGKTGFDVSNARLQVNKTYGFSNNGSTNISVVTNAFGYLGTNLSFETGNVLGWASAADHLSIWADSARAYDGTYSAHMQGSGWTGWSWNNLMQEMVCVSGETLHVTGRVYIKSLQKNGSSWVACGIKMESTNTVGRTSSGVEFNETSTTGSWLAVDFNRTAPVTGTDRLLLWTGGNDGTNLDVFFDNLVITSTNTGAVVTNAIRNGYWEGDTAVNVTNHNALSFWIGGTYGVTNLQVWVKDTGNTTNRVVLTNFLDRIVSLPQRVDIPWTNFATINRSQVKSIGFSSSAASNNAQASRMRSVLLPVLARSRITSAPRADLEGMPLFNAGDIVTNVVTLENVSGSNATGLVIQAVQEYGETTYWWDGSPGVGAMWSARTHQGDRLCGEREQVWSNRTINAGAKLVLTNVYTVPYGRRVDHTKRQFEPIDWYFLRNFACHAQLDVTIRESDGDNLYQNDQCAYYTMDDDNDIDNDGLSDAWELRYAGSYTGFTWDADTDSDGFSNLKEYIAGTDPTNGLSLPFVSAVALTNGSDSAVIWFGSVTGREYCVQWSASLTNADWHLLSSNYVAGSGGTLGIVDGDSRYITNRYYKLGIKFDSKSWPL